MVPPLKGLNLINEHLTCRLCSGYLIDAWTINECLHSFCRPCIFAYFNEDDENTTCPICSAIPHPAKPLLGVTKDCWLQQLVYKLVPSLFKREMYQRRIFYDANSEKKSFLIEQYSRTHPSVMGCREEELGELSERSLFQRKHKHDNGDTVFITLEYSEQGKVSHGLGTEIKSEPLPPGEHQQELIVSKDIRYIECSWNMPVNILKQYLKKVLPLQPRARYHIDIMLDQVPIPDAFTLSHIDSWRRHTMDRKEHFRLFYRVIIIEQQQEDNDNSINKSQETIPEPPVQSALPTTLLIVQSPIKAHMPKIKDQIESFPSKPRNLAPKGVINSSSESNVLLQPLTSNIVNLAVPFDVDVNSTVSVLKPINPSSHRSTTMRPSPSSMFTSLNSFVHTTPLAQAQATTISLHSSIAEQQQQLNGNETAVLLKPKECTMLDCKTFLPSTCTISTPLNYSMASLNNSGSSSSVRAELSSIKPKKRQKRLDNNEQTSTKKQKCKTSFDKEKTKKPPEKVSVMECLPSNDVVIPLNPSPSENQNPVSSSLEQKQLSYSEVIKEANKLLAADESISTSSVPSTTAVAIVKPTTARVTKPIATVSPLHTSKNNTNSRVREKHSLNNIPPLSSKDDKLVDLSKSTLGASIEPPVPSTHIEKMGPSETVAGNIVPAPEVDTANNDKNSSNEPKKRSRQTSSSTTRTKVSRHSNKSNNDDGNDSSSKSLKKTLSHSITTNNSNQFLSPPLSTTTASQQQQHMLQSLFHSFQSQANYWPMSPWAVPSPLALMADPRSYYPQPPWPPASALPPPPPPQPAAMHAPKDLTSASLNDFIGETMPATAFSPHPFHHNPSTVPGNFSLPPPPSLLNSSQSFSRTSSSNSLHQLSTGIARNGTGTNKMHDRHRQPPLHSTLS